jgi:hypothetical protein
MNIPVKYQSFKVQWELCLYVGLHWDVFKVSKKGENVLSWKTLRTSEGNLGGAGQRSAC